MSPPATAICLRRGQSRAGPGPLPEIRRPLVGRGTMAGLVGRHIRRLPPLAGSAGSEVLRPSTRPPLEQSLHRPAHSWLCQGRFPEQIWPSFAVSLQIFQCPSGISRQRRLIRLPLPLDSAQALRHKRLVRQGFAIPPPASQGG